VSSGKWEVGRFKRREKRISNIQYPILNNQCPRKKRQKGRNRLSLVVDRMGQMGPMGRMSAPRRQRRADMKSAPTVVATFAPFALKSFFHLTLKIIIWLAMRLL